MRGIAFDCSPGTTVSARRCFSEGDAEVVQLGIEYVSPCEDSFSSETYATLTPDEAQELAIAILREALVPMEVKCA